MAAIKFELKSLLTKNVLGGGDPLARGVGQPMTFYYCRDTKEMFFTDSVGNFVNFGSVLASVLNGSLPLALPASPVAGPKGEKGDTVVGPAGQSVVGPKGEKGDRGEVLIPNESELAAAVIELRSQRAKVQAALLLEISRARGMHPNTRIHVLNALERVRKEIL